jgi:hypothetical protein
MNNFYKLENTDRLIDTLSKEIQSNSGWFESNGFEILNLPLHIFVETKLFPVIQQFKGTPLIFKLNPMTWYDWHTDETRQCAINMLIEGTDSQTFFGNRLSRDIVELTELTYEPFRYYLINTQQKHAVLNLNNTRYMLSIGFNKPYTFENVLGFCKDINL